MGASNCAHKYRARIRPAALATPRTVLGRGAVLPAAGLGQACTVTTARHGEFGTNTPEISSADACAATFNISAAGFMAKWTHDVADA